MCELEIQVFLQQAEQLRFRVRFKQECIEAGCAQIRVVLVEAAGGKRHDQRAVPAGQGLDTTRCFPTIQDRHPLVHANDVR